VQDEAGVQASDLAAARGSVQVVRWWFDVAELSSLEASPVKRQLADRLAPAALGHDPWGNVLEFGHVLTDLDVLNRRTRGAQAHLGSNAVH